MNPPLAVEMSFRIAANFSLFDARDANGAGTAVASPSV
jgi:hypothetical protein